MIVITQGHDPRVHAVLEMNGRPMAFPDEDQLTLAVVEVDSQGQPQAVLAGFRWHSVPVIEHFDCRPRRLSVPRARRLLRAFLLETVLRGWGATAVTPLDSAHRHYPMLVRLCRRLGGVSYFHTPHVEWVMFTQQGES